VRSRVVGFGGVTAELRRCRRRKKMTGGDRSSANGNKDEGGAGHLLEEKV
jgi:hypothetical protein